MTLHYFVSRVFLDVAETIIGSPVCCGLCIVTYLFNLLYDVIW